MMKSDDEKRCRDRDVLRPVRFDQTRGAQNIEAHATGVEGGGGFQDPELESDIPRRQEHAANHNPDVNHPPIPFPETRRAFTTESDVSMFR